MNERNQQQNHQFLSRMKDNIEEENNSLQKEEDTDEEAKGTRL